MRELAPKLANAEAHFRKLADRMASLHAEAVKLEDEMDGERRDFADEIGAKEEELREATISLDGVDELIERFRDVQRGSRTLDEVLEEWDHGD